MIKKYLLLTALLPVAYIGHAGTFTSIATGNWTAPATWSFSGDADGIPDSDDDVTISTGHTVSVTSTVYGQNITTDGTLSIAGTLYVTGNYTLNGTESGSGYVGFIWSTTGVISGSGSFATTTKYSFSGNNKSIAAGTTITKTTSTSTSIGGNVTVINLGTLSLGPVTAGNSNSTWLNGATGRLNFRTANHFSSPFRIDAGTAGNTVDFAFSDASGQIKTPVSGIFHHLIISGTTTKILSGSITVNGNFTASLGSGFNYNSFNLSVKGSCIIGTTLYTQQSGSVLTLNGSSAQSFTCTGAATTSIPNLTINNAAGVTTVGGIIRITNALTVQSGNLNLGSNYITLVSNASSTARIAESGGTFSGTMTVQRYISARGDGYADMASPMSNDILFSDWDNELLLVYTYSPPESYPSAWSYDENLWDYVPVTSASTVIKSGIGYDVYLDSDGNSATSFPATTVTSVGTPYIGTLDISSNLTADNDGWNLIGNPYAAHLDWTSFQGASGGTISGTYMYYDATIGDFTSASSGTIPPTQGFWVEVLSVPATATFTESMKSTSTSSTFRNSDDARFTLRLTSPKTIFSSNTGFEFGTAYSSGYEKGIDLRFKGVPHPDAPCLYSLTNDLSKLRINRSSDEEALSFNVGMKAGFDGEYTISPLDAELAQVAGYNCILLEDKKTGIITDLSNGAYTFDAMAGEDNERFILHLKKECKNAAISENNPFITATSEGVFVTFNYESMKNAAITLINPLGQEIAPALIIDVSTQKVQLSLPESYTGIYLVSVTVDGKKYTRKLYK